MELETHFQYLVGMAYRLIFTDIRYLHLGGVTGQTFYMALLHHTSNSYISGQLDAYTYASVTCQTRHGRTEGRTFPISYVWPVPFPDNKFIISLSCSLELIKPMQASGGVSLLITDSHPGSCV